MGDKLTFGSLFAGIGGFDLGFDRAGMEPAWFAEIDDNCNQVLSYHWPDVPNLGGVENVGTGTRAVGLVCGGFPCQDLSVAGKREGLSGERSGLWFEFYRVLEELRPRWVVVENVPGLLSSYSGPEPPSDLQPGQEWTVTEESDFGIILRGLAELRYGVSWRIFDAQYSGVAQRRRRVFIVGSLGNGRSAEVLFESEGGCWNHPPSRKTGKELARDVGACIKGGSGQRGFPIEFEAGLTTYGIQPANTGANGRGWQEEVSHTLSGSQLAIAQNTTGALQARDEKGIGSTVDDKLVYTSSGYADFKEGEVGTLRNSGGDIGGGSEVLTVAIPINTMAATRPESSEQNRQAFGVGEDGDPMYTLQENHSRAVAFQQNTRDEVRLIGGDGSHAGSLQAQAGMKQQNYIAFEPGNLTRRCGSGPNEEVCSTKGAAKQGDTFPHIAQVSPTIGADMARQAGGHPGIEEYTDAVMGAGFGVRRLTPTECERLQGFPDGWTDVDGMSDSARYRMLGNAVAVPVAEWIGRRIMEVEERYNG